MYYGGQGIKREAGTRSLVDRLQSFQCELIVPRVSISSCSVTWFESGLLFALLLLPNYERLVIVSTVSGLGFQSGNRNSVAVGAPNLVLL